MSPSAHALFAGEGRIERLSPANRGFAYGDGLFETMRVYQGTLPLWPQHLARLRVGAQRLGVTLPDAAFMQAQIAAMLEGVGAAVLKLLVTRGDGGRGYAPAADATPVWALSLHPLPVVQTDLRLHHCEITLAHQPTLAGIKHCNRLEHVLARAEVVRAGMDEGVLCDSDGRLISATAANVLVRRAGRWFTPPVERCGVAGVLRGWLLAQGLLEVADLSFEDVKNADALALCNAVRGILSVSSFEARRWHAHRETAELSMPLMHAYPMFVPSEVSP